MADTKDKNGAAPQGSFVSAKVFWIVTVILVIGIAFTYFKLDKDLFTTAENMTKAIKETADKQQKFTEDQVAGVTKKMGEEVAKLEAANKKLSDEKDALAKTQTELAGKVDSNNKSVLAAVAKTDSAVAEVTSKANQTQQATQKNEVDIKYLKENVAEMQGKLKGLDKTIDDIKTGSSELKLEQAKIQGDIKAVLAKTNVTESELKEVATRAREFELRVMGEYARQAKEAISKGDSKSLLQVLDIKNPK